MSQQGDNSQDKTEEPTGRQIDKFREEGQVAKSADISSLLVLITGLIVLGGIGPNVVGVMSQGFESILLNRNDNLLTLFISWTRAFVYPVMGYVLIFLFSIMAASLGSTMAQTGIIFSSKAITPKFSNVNPASGLKKIFSSQTLVQFLKNLVKVFVISWIVYAELQGRMGEFVMLSTLSLPQVMSWTVGLISKVVIKIVLLLGSVAIGDYFYQWYTMQQKMKMSKQEIKDEMKDSELPAHVKSKVRQVANERAKKMISKEVPQADVIITNPTHYAIAIRYKRHQDSAPKVVAKGQDYIATLIRKIAEENNIPFYEYPELARTLYRTVKVGRSVPAELYESLARVLAFIFKMNRERKQRRA